MSRPPTPRSLLLLSLLVLAVPVLQPSLVAARSGGAAALQLSQPVSLAAGRSGNVYVLDWSHPHIVKTSSQGSVLTSWSVAPVLAPNPGHIAVDGAENVYFLRNVRHGKSYVGAITKYSSSGRSPSTSFNSAWLNAVGLAAGVNGTLFVLLPGPAAEKTSAAVITVSPTGRIVGTWHLSRYGHDFLAGLSIAVDAHGNVYVAGYVGSCSRGCQGLESYILVRRAPSGAKPVTAWTSGVVTGPGLAVGTDGTVYTAGNYYLMKLSSTGRPLLRWGRVGCGPLQFRALTGLAIGGQSTLYVLDSGNKTIQKISTSGQPEAIWGTCPSAIPPTPILPTPKPKGAA